jgi:predicted ferric reductase
LSPEPSPLWYLDRSAGEVTLILMSTVIVVGVIRTSLPTWSPLLVEGFHSNLALLTIAFAGLHILASILDPYARLGPVDALVPFVSAYRGTWLGFGVISGYLYAAVALSSWPARRLGRAGWQWLHRSIYVGWVAALIHSLGTGTDATNGVFLLLLVAAVTAVIATFLAFRVADARHQFPLRAAAAGITAVLIVVVLAIWAVNGPMQPGWARASGTPPDMLRSP